MITRSDQQDLRLREYMRGGKKHVKMIGLSSELPKNARLFSKLVLEPGASIGYHVHEGETEMFYFMEGTARVQDDDKFYDVCAGDCMSTPSGHGHSVENIGGTDLVIIATIILD